MRNIILAIAISLSIGPALAGDGSTPVIVFRAGHKIADDIVWTKSSNIHAPDKCFDFTPIEGNRVASDYRDGGSSYYLAEPMMTVPRRPIPDVISFEESIWKDQQIGASAKLGLATIYPVLEHSALVPEIIQSAWSALVQVNAPSAKNPTGWLTLDLQSKVLSAASQKHISLTP